MNKLAFISVVVSFLVLIPFSRVLAQNVATVQASATIFIPLSASEALQLNFGRFFPGDQGGTIVISPDGSVITSSTVVADASPKSPGSFFVSGETDATFSIALPNGPATLTNSDTSDTMVVSDWVSLPENGDTGVKLSGGTQTVLVGATLQVGSLSENPKGIYTGSYQITFAYN